MPVYISLVGAILVVIIAIILWSLFGPIGLLLLILAAVLFYVAFGTRSAAAIP
jgi:hypothetical protein